MVNTPGITLKDQFKISVDDYDDVIEIIDELPQYESAQFNMEIKVAREVSIRKKKESYLFLKRKDINCKEKKIEYRISNNFVNFTY